MLYQKNKNYFQIGIYGLATVFLMFIVNKAIHAEPGSKALEAVRVLQESEAIPVLKKPEWPYYHDDTQRHPDKNDHDKDNTKGAEDVVEIIVEDNPPIQLPEAFVAQLRERGIAGITLGNADGQIRLLSIDGRYVNPCLDDSGVKTSRYPSKESAKPCRFEGGIGEVHMLIASADIQNPCGKCKANNITRVCKKSSHKYSCSGQIKSCETSCR